MSKPDTTKPVLATTVPIDSQIVGYQFYLQDAVTSLNWTSGGPDSGVVVYVGDTIEIHIKRKKETSNGH